MKNKVCIRKLYFSTEELVTWAKMYEQKWYKLLPGRSSLCMFFFFMVPPSFYRCQVLKALCFGGCPEVRVTEISMSHKYNIDRTYTWEVNSYLFILVKYQVIFYNDISHFVSMWEKKGDKTKTKQIYENVKINKPEIQ